MVASADDEPSGQCALISDVSIDSESRLAVMKRAPICGSSSFTCAPSRLWITARQYSVAIARRLAATRTLMPAW